MKEQDSKDKGFFTSVRWFQAVPRHVQMKSNCFAIRSEYYPGSKGAICPYSGKALVAADH